MTIDGQSETAIARLWRFLRSGDDTPLVFFSLILIGVTRQWIVTEPMFRVLPAAMVAIAVYLVVALYSQDPQEVDTDE